MLDVSLLPIHFFLTQLWPTLNSNCVVRYAFLNIANSTSMRESIL